MEKHFTLAVTGDTVIDRRLSVCSDERFLSVVQVIRDADVAYTHLETVIHDYEGPELYPAAEGAGGWLRAPQFLCDELKWMGFDIVSHASNHCLDYSYGGLMSTWKALKDAGIPFAGTGMNLAEAREPAYLDTGKGRVALISMCSSFTRGSRAGEARRDIKGRPGLNPLRFYHTVDTNAIETIKQFAIKLGWWVEHYDNVWLFNPPGLHNTIHKFVVRDEPGFSTVAEEDDVEGNLRSLRQARQQADYVLVHLHNHEFHPEKGLGYPPDFVPPFARACIDSGADVFIAEGSGAELRGIEIYQGKPIFYDLGGIVRMLTFLRLPFDFYFRPGYSPEIRKWEATATDGLEARQAYQSAIVNPPGGYQSQPVGRQGVVAVCTFGEQRKLIELKLHPTTRCAESVSQAGIPLLPDAAVSKKIIEFMRELSAPYCTEITFKGGTGLVKLSK